MVVLSSSSWLLMVTTVGSRWMWTEKEAAGLVRDAHILVQGVIGSRAAALCRSERRASVFSERRASVFLFFSLPK